MGNRGAGTPVTRPVAGQNGAVDSSTLDRLRPGLERLLRAGVPAAGRGLLGGLLSAVVNPLLAALSLITLALVPVGLGVLTFPTVAEAVRWRAGLARRFAGAAGVPITTPYRPAREGGIWRRFRDAVTDPATWRDLAWLVPGAVVGGVCGLLAFGLPLYGLEGASLIPLWLHLFGVWYGWGPFWPITHTLQALACLPLGLLVLGGGLVAAPRLVGVDARFAALLLRPTAAAALGRRVEQLTRTRAETVDAQAAELRRIERDLHDGAQARLVSVSMTIGLAEELMKQDPAAAAKLLAEARESSGLALTELRQLVRGIHPPVLAERGLDGAIRALALALPMPVAVDVELPGRPAAPVESAAYFAVAEVLANVARHSGATWATVCVSHHDGVLRIEVDDDGRGGADPAGGTGLRGIERRLAAFDGIMAVSSPPGGPTVVTMELPCVLSSPRISPSSGTG
jgi:signal transduction histidine kinase